MSSLLHSILVAHISHLHSLPPTQMFLSALTLQYEPDYTAKIGAPKFFNAPNPKHFKACRPNKVHLSGLKKSPSRRHNYIASNTFLTLYQENRHSHGHKA
jgi:hypothetical protein